MSTATAAKCDRKNGKATKDWTVEQAIAFATRGKVEVSYHPDCLESWDPDSAGHFHEVKARIDPDASAEDDPDHAFLTFWCDDRNGGVKRGVVATLRRHAETLLKYAQTIEAAK